MCVSLFLVNITISVRFEELIGSEEGNEQKAI